jgi:CRISPR/Cas system-associated exonuclease Cas4 (RecB family)
MSQNNLLTLSQQKLTTFLTCQRRFYLRYRANLPWPEPPLPAEQEASLELGQQFHQLLERHFLGLPVEASLGDNGRLRHWWSQFQTHPPDLPPGRRLPEAGLTVPLSGERYAVLVGRFDLVVLGQTAAGEPAIHIYDWKTGRPQPADDLRRSWQTRLYLALAAAGGHSLFGRSGKAARVSAEAVRLTYWYVNAPDEPRTIGYSQAAHEQTWAELTAVAAQIQAKIAAETADSTSSPDTHWPKTEDWSHCTFCAYRAYCGRQQAATHDQTSLPHDEEPDPTETAVWELEPGGR